MSTRKKPTEIKRTEVLPLPPSLDNLRVVDRCCVQANAAREEALAAGKDEELASHIGKRSFRAAMPAPLDPESTTDFIACVTFGVIAGLFSLKEANTLCYAAQVALSTHRAHRETKRA